jgi:hypothetical protein
MKDNIVQPSSGRLVKRSVKCETCSFVQRYSHCSAFTKLTMKNDARNQLDCNRQDESICNIDHYIIDPLHASATIANRKNQRERSVSELEDSNSTSGKTSLHRGTDSSRQVNNDLVSPALPLSQETAPSHHNHPVQTVVSFSSLSSADLPNTPNASRKKSGKRSRHKRDKSFLVQLTVSLKDAHMMRHPWDFDSPALHYRAWDDEYCGNTEDDPHQHAYVTPDFKHLFYLTAALMLCTSMAVFSAYDAEQHCLQHEALAVWQLVDDDAAAAVAAAMEQRDNADNYKCIQMFRDVVLPTGIATAVASLVVLGIIYWYIKSTNVESSANIDSTSDSESHASQQDLGVSTNASATSLEWGPVIRVTLFLFALFIVILGLQTYNVTAVMLKPRADLTDEDAGSNPYQSLAAVDRFGHVGDNANLYYLAWLNEGLAIALVYQVATAIFRVLRAARRKESDGLMKTAEPTDAEKSIKHETSVTDRGANKDFSSELLRATSWDRGLTDSQRIKKRMLNDQSRAAWYSSLYRLRVRTGMWTAACISCLIIVASSQYIWRQVLWPFISSILHHDDSSFSYFSICQAASTSSSMYYSKGYSLQLCRRTLAAWCSGLLAAILCATAIAMHQVARYSPSATSHSHHTSMVVEGGAHRDGRSGRDELSSTDGLSSTHLYYDHGVMHLLTTPDGLCPAATSGWRNALPSALLRRYYSHHHPKRLPLRTELGLAFLLSIVLGINAVLTTGVQGPALKVGNLYYSSWLSFLLCVRICLGCVEEFYNITEEDDDGCQVTVASSSENASAASGGKRKGDTTSYRAPELANAAPFAVQSEENGSVSLTNSMGLRDIGQGSSDTTNNADSQETKRLGRVRGYFFLSIFSTVCAASSYDAAVNQNKALSRDQKFMMYIPRIVAAISSLLFALSLSKRCYAFISQFWVGGVLSVVAFLLWLGDLLLTMHSEDSWAVNSIGEIAMANLYYFAWASIITAGVQMTSYVKSLFGIEKLDYMSAVWVAICKVCFVILGASLHIWHTISDNCEFDEITLGAVSFCSRTILAIVVSLTGMLVGGLVVLGRLLAIMCPICRCGRFQAHVEMLISLFLMFLFVAAVALITGIGGPGQSVGDLYYSTWMAFWVSLGIFVSCYNQLNEKEKEIDGQDTQQSDNKESSSRLG